MKTEQEQIDKIQEIIGDCYEYDSISAEFGSGDGYINIEEAADALIKAGYGDISEYKAEIERLKAEYKQLETNAEILARGVRDLNHENYELTEKVKQAQIDVLNKVKNCRDATDSDCYPYLERIVNKLIKEVQNAEDKG